MRGSQVQALEEEGRIEWNEERGVYEQIDEEGLFMHTIERHDSDAEDLKREADRETLFEALADAGMSMSDFR